MGIVYQKFTWLHTNKCFFILIQCISDTISPQCSLFTVCDHLICLNQQVKPAYERCKSFGLKKSSSKNRDNYYKGRKYKYKPASVIKRPKQHHADCTGYQAGACVSIKLCSKLNQ